MIQSVPPDDLLQGAFRADAPLRAVIVGAHPDDEAIGLGVHLRSFRDLAAIIHTTDGAPRRGDDVRNAGCRDWKEYAEIRQAEFRHALQVSGAVCRHSMNLRFPDQELTFRLGEAIPAVTDALGRLNPSLVLTHPYEGGHPDHDSTAIAVHAARFLLGSPFTIMEFSSYHASPAGIACECFLANGDAAETPVPLTNEQRLRKQAIFDAYSSQRAVLEQFPISFEPIRQAPSYDFTRPPHRGDLYYERFPWGVKAAQWRDLAAAALQQLGLDPAEIAVRRARS